MKTKIRAIVVVPLGVTLLIAAVSFLSYLIATSLALPAKLALPVGVRFFGVLLLATGFLLLSWLFKHRSPIDVLLSTYSTLTAALAKSRRIQQPRRSEPLVITGPHRMIRHPLYTAALILLIGWWLLLDYTFILICAVLMAIWFRAVVAPFEERELQELFGSQYEEYARTTPRFFPSIRFLRTPKSNR